MSFINVLFKRVTTAIRGTEAIQDGKILLDYERPSIYVDNGSTRVELTPRDTSLSTTSTNAIANNALTNSIINTTAEVSAITADNIPCGTKPVKELINSLTGEYLLLSDVFASGEILSATDVNVIKKNNQITISGTVYASVVSNTNVLIGVLKTAYKPIKRTTSCFSGTSPANYGVVIVALDGTITLGANVTNASYCAFNVTYLIA